MDINAYLETLGGWFLTSGLRILLVVILTLIALKAAKLLAAKALIPFRKRKEDVEFEKRADTLSSVIRYILTIGIVLVASMMVLRELGIEIGPILAAAGILGLAVGFGAQSLVRDVITGFFIILEDQIRVGDVVEIAGRAGLVERVNLRMVVLRDLEGKVHYVENGEISVVTNFTKEFSCYVFDIGVAYRENVDEVIALMKQVDEDMRQNSELKDEILEPLEVFGLDRFADSAVVIKARYKTRTLKQWGVAREFNRRLKQKFDDNDIEIPFPHRTLYIGKDKNGVAPPLHVAVEGNGRSRSETTGVK